MPDETTTETVTGADVRTVRAPKFSKGQRVKILPFLDLSTKERPLPAEGTVIELQDRGQQPGLYHVEWDAGASQWFVEGQLEAI